MLGRTGVITGTTSACAENTQRLPKNRCWIPNYLRMRGEYPSSWVASLRRWELPPHARRIPIYRRQRVFGAGTTSACAENTCARLTAGLPHRELPPHARRKRCARLRPKSFMRTTSACAENTFCMICGWLLHRNYLRVRGEYPGRNLTTRQCEELPPRARRILGGGFNADTDLGTTSACAENTTEKRL